MAWGEVLPESNGVGGEPHTPSSMMAGEVMMSHMDTADDGHEGMVMIMMVMVVVVLIGAV